MANRGMNRCCPLYLMHYCCYCAFTTIYIGFCVVGYNAISESRDTALPLTKLLTCQLPMRSSPTSQDIKHTDSWANGRLIFIIIIITTLAKQQLAVLAIYLHDYIIFFALTYLHVHSICTCRCTFDVLKRQFSTS